MHRKHPAAAAAAHRWCAGASAQTVCVAVRGDRRARIFHRANPTTVPRDVDRPGRRPGGGAFETVPRWNAFQRQPACRRSVASDDRAMTAVYLAPGYGGITIILRCALAAPPSVGAGDKW
jgi:hypothetical protein